MASINKLNDDQLHSLCLNLNSEKNNVEIIDMTPDTLKQSSGQYDEQLEQFKKLVEKKFKTVISGIAEINLKLDRLGNKKDGNKEFSATEKKILKFIPLTSNEDLLKFEEIITTNSDVENELMLFVKKTGGTSHKELITRSLKRIFADVLAKDCSWLGQRNNIKMCNLRTISVVKDVTTSNFVCDDKEFEGICAEWFRQGKQRYARDVKRVNYLIN